MNSVSSTPRLTLPRFSQPALDQPIADISSPRSIFGAGVVPALLRRVVVAGQCTPRSRGVPALSPPRCTREAPVGACVAVELQSAMRERITALIAVIKGVHTGPSHPQCVSVATMSSAIRRLVAVMRFGTG